MKQRVWQHSCHPRCFIYVKDWEVLLKQNRFIFFLKMVMMKAKGGRILWQKKKHFLLAAVFGVWWSVWSNARYQKVVSGYTVGHMPQSNLRRSFAVEQQVILKSGDHLWSSSDFLLAAGGDLLAANRSNGCRWSICGSWRFLSSHDFLCFTWTKRSGRGI